MKLSIDEYTKSCFLSISEYRRYRIGSRKVDKDMVKYVVMDIADDTKPPMQISLPGNKSGKDPLKGIVNVELRISDTTVLGIMTDDECVVKI